MLKVIAHAIPARILFCTRFGEAFQALLYRYWCPYSNLSARECCRRGECGCDNQDRYPGPALKRHG